MYKGYIEAVFSKDNSGQFSVFGIDYHQPPNLILMHGVSGSGKSTVAEYLKQQIESKFYNSDVCVICSTDNYHYVDGEYRFNAAKLGEYHKENQRVAVEHLSKGDIVIVDNTNCNFLEMINYILPCFELDINFCIVEPIGPGCKDAETLSKRNKHSVPIESIKKMLDRFECKKQLEMNIKVARATYDWTKG